MKKLVSVAAALVLGASVAMADTASIDNNQAQAQQPSAGVMQAQPNSADKQHKKDDKKTNMLMTTAAKKKVKAHKTPKKAATNNAANPAKPVADSKA